MAEFDSVYLRDLQRRLRDGDTAARDELVRASMKRLELLARKMLKGFPAVKRWEDTMDVLNQSLVRLLRSLETVEVQNTRDFFNFAATHIRRQLIDLARHYLGPEGHGRHHQSGLFDPAKEGSPPDPVDRASSSDLEHWAILHESIDNLPSEEREVFSLTFYHGWTQPQIAALFDVSEKTIRRRYHSAIQHLADKLRDVPLTQ